MPFEVSFLFVRLRSVLHRAHFVSSRFSESALGKTLRLDVAQ